MKNVVFLLALFLASISTWAQPAPVHSQYFLNPFIYNPAYAGYRGSSEVFLTRHMSTQRTDGAHTISTLSLHLPTAGKKLAFGVNIVDNASGLLTSTSAMLTTSYTLHLGKDHFLRAGISGGLSRNSADLDKLEGFNDQTILKLIRKKTYFDANFGVNYQLKGLNLGASFPTLLNQQLVNTHYRNEIKFSQLNYYVFNAGYAIPFGKQVTFTPQVLYRMSNNNSMPSQYEGIGVVTLLDKKKNNKLWFGGGYRQGFGPTVSAGTRVSKNIKIGYAYESLPQQAISFPKGNHEVMLNIRFEQKKIKNQPVNHTVKKEKEEKKEKEQEKAKEKAEKLAQAKKAKEEAAAEKKAQSKEEKTLAAAKEADKRNAQKEKALAEKAKKAEKAAAKKEKAAAKKEKTAAKAKEKKASKKAAPANKPAKEAAPAQPAVQVESEPIEIQKHLEEKTEASPVPAKNQVEKTLEAKAPVNPMELPVGNYVVVGSFSVKENAMRYAKTLQSRGFNSQCQYSSHSNHYYVYVASDADVEAARAERDRMRQMDGFEYTWVLIIQ